MKVQLNIFLKLFETENKDTLFPIHLGDMSAFVVNSIGVISTAATHMPVWVFVNQ
jgi:hypothetical protein